MHQSLSFERDFTSMVVQDRLVISLERPILKQILKLLGFSYVQFAQELDIGITTLEQYRRGTRQFRLNMEQFKTLISLLDEVGLTIHDLPNDWIIDKPNN
jgi:transcriptional regulator with XRE-family HTH domain